MTSDNPTDVQSKHDSSLQPWQFFVLAALGCATAVTFLVRNHGFVPVILLSVMMATTALVGLAMLRAVRPLVNPNDDRGAVVGHRLRVLLEQDKALALRTIKELEFDRAMGKISEEDFRDISTRAAVTALRLNGISRSEWATPVRKPSARPGAARIARRKMIRTHGFARIAVRSFKNVQHNGHKGYKDRHFSEADS